MTLAPLVDPSIRGVAGKPAVVTDYCVAPECPERAQHRHHLWSRSYLRGQPTEWITVQDTVIPNVVGLCVQHHIRVTGTRGHLAHIRWNEDLKILEWWENVREAGPLSYSDDRWVCRGPLRGQGIVTAAPLPPRTRAVEVCETCGKPKRPKEKLPPGPARKVKTWSLAVPDDTEQGAEILDTYVENLGLRMGFDDMSARLLRYHVIVPALEWVSQNENDFIADWRHDE